MGSNFCECGSLIISEKCSNKKCGKIHKQPTQFEMNLANFMDRVNNPLGKFDISTIKSFDGIIPASKEFNIVDSANYDDSMEDFGYYDLKKANIPMSFSQCRLDEEDNYVLERFFLADMAKLKHQIVTPMHLNFIWLIQYIDYKGENKEISKCFKDNRIKFIIRATPNNKFYHNAASPRRTRELDGDWKKDVEDFPKLMLNNYYTWKVYLKNESDIIGITVPVNASSIKELFKFREIPQGKERRTALFHWVSKHYRRKSGNATYDELVEIHKYLRGQTEFDWNGLTCKIIPSADDLATLQRIKKEGIA